MTCKDYILIKLTRDPQKSFITVIVYHLKIGAKD